MAEFKSIGIQIEKSSQSIIERVTEEVRRNGYSIITSILESAFVEEARKRLDAIYAKQEKEFGLDHLKKIKDQDMARSLLVYDDFFLQLATQPTVLSIVRKLMGDYIVLNLQNGIINQPNREHHQSSWHRDLPYQEFVISKPLALNALYAIDDFTVKSGATWIVPGTHLFPHAPTVDFIEKYKIPAEAPAGSVIIFDSMLFHGAGTNSGTFTRRAINNLYTIPILSQQISFPQSLKGKYSENKELRRLLGYDCEPPTSVAEWGEKRMRRVKEQEGLVY